MMSNSNGLLVPVLLLLLFATNAFRGATAFAVVTLRPKATKTTTRLHNADYDPDGRHQSFPRSSSPPADVKRAKECADNFGKCTVQEMQDLKDSLHRERVQNFLFGGSAMTEPGEDALQHVMLEEELELQLNLLKEHEGDPTLFPEVEEPMPEALPHLKDDTSAHRDAAVVHQAQQTLALEETVLEESNLEAMALCAATLFLIFVPQLLHVS